MNPVWDGRSSDVIASELNKIFEMLKLPFKAIVEGEPKCYDTVRYGYVCSYDFLPVFIVDSTSNRKVPAKLVLSFNKHSEISEFGVHEGYGEGRGKLILPDRTVEFDFTMTACDYDYKFKFYNPKLVPK